MSFGWSASAAQAPVVPKPAASRRGSRAGDGGARRQRASGTGAASTGALGARLAATPALSSRSTPIRAGRLARAALRPGAPRGGRRGRGLLPRATVGRRPSPRGRLLRARTVTGETFAGDPAALLADVRAGQFRRLRSRERHHRPLRSRTQRRPRARPFRLRMDARAGTRSIRAHRVHVHRVHPSRRRRRSMARSIRRLPRHASRGRLAHYTHLFRAHPRRR